MSGPITTAQFRLGSSAQDRSDRFIYNNENGDFFINLDGKGGDGQLQFGTLTGAPKLTKFNIVVV